MSEESVRQDQRRLDEPDYFHTRTCQVFISPHSGNFPYVLRHSIGFCQPRAGDRIPREHKKAQLDACTPQVSHPAPDQIWISLAQAAEGTPYSQEYLSLLARKGRLEAIKRGRVWLTTRQAVSDYRRSVEKVS